MTPAPCNDCPVNASGLAFIALREPGNLCINQPMANRIKELRTAAGMTQQDLADRMDVDISTIYRYESGAAVFFRKNAIELARLLGVKSPEELLAAPAAKIRLAGYVGAGAQVFPLDDDFDELDPPPGMEGGFALQIRGRSMLPVFRPDQILFMPPRTHVSDDVLGEDCCVQVTNGPRLIKRVNPGSTKGFFRLYSYDTQDESEDVTLDWAAPVMWVKRYPITRRNARS